MAESQSASVRVGQLLIASAALRDPNFTRSLVLILDTDDDGALGVVLNRPTPVPVEEVLEAWRDQVSEPGTLFQGGPVGTDSAIAVGRRRDAEPPVGFRALFGEIGLVDLDTPPELMDGALVRLRVFAGYSGWGTGQLEAEIAEGSWYVVEAEPDDIFAADPESLWRQVLQRQPGDLAWHATRPMDPELN